MAAVGDGMQLCEVLWERGRAICKVPLSDERHHGPTYSGTSTCIPAPFRDT